MTRRIDLYALTTIQDIAEEYDLDAGSVISAVRQRGKEVEQRRHEVATRASGLTCQCAAANFDPCPIHERVPDASD